MRTVVGIGNPLMDFIMHSGYEILSKYTNKPGTMNLVERSTINDILLEHSNPQIIPGGSCANTLRGIAWLLEDGEEDEKPAYIGAVGNDEYGDKFASILNQQGVEPFLSRKETPTGVSGIVVTPDHERTMFTYLGACRDLTVGDVSNEIVCSGKYIYMAGYMWDTENQKMAAKKSVDSARSCGVKVAFDLADPFVVHRYGEELREWIPGNVDILFANREELSVMTGFGMDNNADNREILTAARSLADLIVLKIGAKGCMILEGSSMVKIPAVAVVPLDTTAAGDSFAAGFLYGMLKGKDLYQSGIIANRLAAQVVTAEGCNYQILNRKSVIDLTGTSL